jgi:GNAT superfamily N-acetyltransferase
LTEIDVAPARTHDELTAFRAIGSEVHPGLTPSVAALEHELATGAGTMFLLASLGGSPVGSGVGKSSSVGDSLFAMVRVRAAYRRAGVGTAILAALFGHARARGYGSLIGRLREDDDDARGFAEHRGFGVLSRECPVFLDLARVGETEPEPPPGVVIASLAERPDLVEAAYAVHAEALRDVPVGSEAPTARPFDAWRAETVDGPDALLDLSLVALLGDDVVGWAGLAVHSGEPGVAENLLTGVLREARGGGIATALKREQAWRAKRAGLRRIETVNDEANAPMRAVNARLGFEAEPVWLLVRGPLA